MATTGARLGAGAFAVGLCLFVAHSPAIASADDPDPASPSSSPGSAVRADAGPARTAGTADRGRQARTGRPHPRSVAPQGGPPPAGTSLPSVGKPSRAERPPAAVGPRPAPSRRTSAQIADPAPTATAATAEPACAACWGLQAPTPAQAVNTVVNHLFNSSFDLLSGLPGGPLLEGALVLIRRSLFLLPEGVTATQSGNSLTIAVNTGSVAYLRQDGTSLQVSGDPWFWGAPTFDAATIATVAVTNSPGNAGCAGLVVDSGTIAADLVTSQIDSIRFDTGAAFTETVTAAVTGGPLTVRNAVRGLGGVTLDAAVVLGNDVEVDAGDKDARFGSTVDATAPGKQSLTVTALGTTTFEAAVGAQTALGGLLTRAITPLSIPQSADTKNHRINNES